MTSLFGGDTAKDYMKQQGRFVKGAIRGSTNLIDSSKATDWLTKASQKLDTRLGGPQAGRSDAYNYDINNGNLRLGRTGETQNFFDALRQNRGTTDSGYADLLNSLGAGGAFSRLQRERDRELQEMKRRASGDLRAQLARRRVQGASFAEDQVRGLEAEYDRQRDLSRAESIVQDLQMTKEVISARAKDWISNISTALSQIQFEGNLLAGLQASAQQGMTQLAALQAGLAELGAKLTLEGQVAKAGISANLSGIQAGSYPGFAELASQEKAGLGSMIGTLIGGGLGFIGGGPAGAAVGASAAGGGNGNPLGYSPFK